MNWFDKIKKLLTGIDDSPELKKGEIKEILVETSQKILPDFEYLAYKDRCYIFQRLRKADDHLIYENLHINFTLKDKNFACSIASRLNPKLIFTNPYNSGLINPHKDLKVLRHNSSALSIPKAYYFHNGQIGSTTKIVREIFENYKKYGLPFLDKQFEVLKVNEIIRAGFTFIGSLNINKETLKQDLIQDLKIGGLRLSNIKHPLYLDLKERLQNIPMQSVQDRRLIPKTAYEFLELYCII